MMQNEARSSRKVKKIHLDIWEDSEATFYLALSSLRESATIKPDDVKALIESISFPEIKGEELEIELVRQLKKAWKYILAADRFSKGDYVQFSGDNFLSFLHGEFGQSLLSVYYHCKNLQTVAKNPHDFRFKEDMSFFSFLMDSVNSRDELTRHLPGGEKVILSSNGGDSHDHVMEVDLNGVFEFTDENLNVFKTEVYVGKQTLLEKISSFEGLHRIEEMPVVYIHVIGAYVLMVERNAEEMCRYYLRGATIKDNKLDLSNLKKTDIQKLPIKGIPLFDPTSKDPYDQAEYVPNSNFQIDVQPSGKPLKLNKDFVDNYQIPERINNENFVRFKIVSSLYREVDKWFPRLSFHVKAAITGYLSIPFNVLDTEEEHDDSTRTSSYHAYVGKTVKNILNSKPG